MKILIPVKYFTFNNYSQHGFMNKKWVLLLLLVVFAACKNKKPKAITDEDITAADFISLAAPLPFPILINDSMINKKGKDSSLINQAAFQTFIPDSVFQQLYPTTKQLKLYLIGKATDEQKGNYVLVKSILEKVKKVQLFYFDKESIFLSAIDIGNYLPKGAGAKYCRIDNKFNIAFILERKTPTGELWTNEAIYYMDQSGKFIMAMTNSTEDLSDVIMGNPIDTFARINKFSADYTSDKKNLVSIRDGASSKTFRFFIHFSKQNGDCVGEVKGEAEWIGKSKGIFRDGNSDCVIEFNFSTSSVSIKEQNGCGSYRGITCFFEGSYPKKREPVQPKPKSKKKK